MYATKDANKKYEASKYTAAVEYCTTCLKNKACSKTAQEYVSKYRIVKEKMKADKQAKKDKMKEMCKASEKKEKKVTNRKIQGNGKYFNSQISFTILDKVDKNIYLIKTVL